ncbi:J domain-containing protein [Mycoavidus sp. SF9855]|uniref:J domain-containing protein n=1 Tax=Mycoavidus sp. SF9855 TaxID=2968475 RepID=UPI00211CA133|nr:J domain-containing protein [Mycoavidus sp. SF9855]UUM22338.1 J domain-containing protein [Mycoavidus sp. SF9855]
MTRTNNWSVSIASDQNNLALSKEQKAFNSLIKQIDKRRKRLGAWETMASAFQQQYVNDLLPLEQTSTALQIQMVHCLDRAYGQKGLTQAERRKTAAVIVDWARDLIDEEESLKTIYNKYNPIDYDSETATEVDDMKSMLEAMLGVNLGDDLDISSPEDLLQHAQAHIEQQQVKAEAETTAREARRAARKKSPKQLAAEARAHEEQAQISLSIREVYRKLASALHPDREADPQERDRKTKLMQRVNAAYTKNNLLQLLELQLELEHIDQHSINGISENRLKHYNKVLKEQVRELDQEILHVEATFRHTYGIGSFEELSPDIALRNLAIEIKNFRQNIRVLERDLVAFEDIKNVKCWLKTFKLASARSISFV